MKKTVVLALIASFALVGVARAEGPNPIPLRQAGQDLLLGDFHGIVAVVKAKGDVTKLAQPAKAMARWMGEFVQLFPPGSDQGHTKALPAIWSDNAGFRKDADRFIAAADTLAVIAKTGDVAKVAAQVHVVGKACGACHHSFRAH